MPLRAESVDSRFRPFCLGKENMIITTRAVPQGRNNDKDWPAFYECNFLEPGMVNYADAGAGLAYLSKESILKMLPTFMGKPVIDEQHIDVSPGTYKKHAVGYITKVWFDDVANWAKCQFILTDDKAKANVAMGYSVSCAYDNVVTGPGGERNAVRYDEEILDGFGNHLALVTQPRYESCKIQPCMMLINSKRASIKEGEGKQNTVTVKVANEKKKYTVTRKFTSGTLDGLEHTEETDTEFKEGQAVKNPIGGSPYIITKVVKNAIPRICDSCDYLVQGKCEVAGPGGKISQRYADARVLGQIQECSAYEEAGERRIKENLVTVKTVNK